MSRGMDVRVFCGVGDLCCRDKQVTSGPLRLRLSLQPFRHAQGTVTHKKRRAQRSSEKMKMRGREHVRECEKQGGCEHATVLTRAWFAGRSGAVDQHQVDHGRGRRA
eukprot:3285412-Rhodomonas_salina.2